MKRAFTLIELLIVIAIIAILALIAVPNFLEAQTRAKVARVLADMRSIATAIEAYSVDYGAYPLCMMSNNTNVLNRNYGFRLKGYNALQDDYIAAMGMTTPVAYISDFPVDPFTDKLADGNITNVSYYYFNVSGAAQQIAIAPWANAPNISPGALIKFHGPDGSEQPVNWMLESAGPDRQINEIAIDAANTNLFGDHRLIQQEVHWNKLRIGRFHLYDPSNGTTSNGNIWRLSGGEPR